jgi:aspartate kinase
MSLLVMEFGGTSVGSPGALGQMDAIEGEMALELVRRDVDRVWALDEVVIITAVDADMWGTPGVPHRLFGALARADINVIAVAQGSSECSISLAVAAEVAADAVCRIHEEVINHVHA